MSWSALKPAVPRAWLAAIAGLVWCGVGVMLCVHAVGWLRALHDALELPLGAGGLVLGIAAYILMFSRIARKNTTRIASLPARVCLFAFQGWRGYGIIAFMIALGVVLRHSPIPKHYLAVAYLAIGIALVMSSVVLYRKFVALRSEAA
jgi:uncharacterized protein with PQ loop repeat